VSQKKTWCRTFCDNFITVNRFWKFFHCWK